MNSYYGHAFIENTGGVKIIYKSQLLYFCPFSLPNGHMLFYLLFRLTKDVMTSYWVWSRSSSSSSGGVKSSEYSFLGIVSSYYKENGVCNIACPVYER